MSATSVPTLDHPTAAHSRRTHDLCRWLLQPEVTIRIVLYLSALVYLRTILFDYVYDDTFLLLLNPGMESWKAVPGFFTHSFWGFLEIPRAIDYYRPLVMVVLAAIHHLLGTAPGWFHLVTAGVHIFATYLVYRLVCETVADKSIAAISAGIFGLHPTKVETAAWISGVSDSLSAVFFLASMIAYFKWKRGGTNNRKLVAISAGFLLLALFSKEAAIFASLLLAIYEFSAAKPGFRNRSLAVVRNLWPFALVTVVAAATRTLLIRNHARQVADIPVVPTLLSAPQAILWYLAKQVWPIGLSVYYPIRIVSQPSFTGFLLPGLALVVACIFLLRQLRKTPVGLFFASWFVVMLAPTILYHSTLQEHDRYFYFASVATSVGLAYVIAQLRQHGAGLQAATVFLLFAGMCALTYSYESYWDNDLKLFTRAAQIAPTNPNVADYLISVYVNQHQFERATAVAEALIKTPEVGAQGWYALGNVRFAEGRYEEARKAMEHAADLAHGRNLLSNIGLATADLQLGRNAEAARIYENAIKSYPYVACLHGGLANALIGLGRREEAERELELQKRLQ